MHHPGLHLPILVAVATVVLLALGCGIGQPREPALLPAGLAEARVPDVQLEVFAYIVAPDGDAVARELGFSSAVAPSYLAVWLAPWEGELVWGATLELPSESAARLAAALLTLGRGRAISLGRHLAVVRSDSAAGASLASAIQQKGQKGLVPFTGRNPGALAVIAWLPARAPAGAAGPQAVAYAHLGDEVLADLARRTGSQELADVAESLRGARISRAAAAIYAPETLDLTALGDLEQMGAQTAGIVVAPARVPGALVGNVLRSSAGGLGLEPASLPGGPAFTRMLGPQRLYVASVGNKLYVSFSQEDARAQAVLDSARQGR